MMKWKRLARVIPPLLCISLCACAATPAVCASSGMTATAVSLSAYVEPAASSVTLELSAPTGWSRDSAEVSFTITDRSGACFSTAEVKVGQSGIWRDVTDTLDQIGSQFTGTVEVSGNGPVRYRCGARG